MCRALRRRRIAILDVRAGDDERRYEPVGRAALDLLTLAERGAGRAHVGQALPSFAGGRRRLASRPARQKSRSVGVAGRRAPRVAGRLIRRTDAALASRRLRVAILARATLSHLARRQTIVGTGVHRTLRAEGPFGLALMGDTCSIDAGLFGGARLAVVLVGGSVCVAFQRDVVRTAPLVRHAYRRRRAALLSLTAGESASA